MKNMTSNVRMLLAMGVIAIAIVGVLLLGGSPNAASPTQENAAQTEEGKISKSLRLGAMGGNDLEQLRVRFNTFRNTFLGLSGIRTELTEVPSSAAGIEAIKNGELDLLLVSAVDYMALKNDENIVALMELRPANSKSAIVAVSNDEEEVSLAELKGKSIAFGEKGSLTEHLAPALLLKKQGIDPLNDVNTKHLSADIITAALLRGEVSAISVEHKKWLEEIYANESPQVQEQLVVLAISENLPGDVLLVGQHVNEVTRARLLESLMENPENVVAAIGSTEGNEKYKGASLGFEFNDGHFDVILEMFEATGYSNRAELYPEE